MRKYIPHILIISFVFLAIHITSATGGSITLRSHYRSLSVSQVHSIPNVSMRNIDEYGFIGHSIINHDYNFKNIGGDMVVVDNATGLMWHQGGSDYMKWKKAKKWIRKLNKRGYAGYQDWRLPTVDEAVSLLEPSKKNKEYDVDLEWTILYIDPFFGGELMIWTGDECEDGSEAAWGVSFYHGGVSWDGLYGGNAVRPVRSME